MFEKDSSQKDSVLTLTARQLSLGSAGILMFVFFVFIGGYFLGQKRAAQEFSYKADQDSLADQIYSSMCVLYDSKDESDVSENADDTEGGDIVEVTQADSEQKEEPSKIRYTAVLSGFPAKRLKRAQEMITKWNNRGYMLELVEHSTQTPRGTTSWYQVILKSSDSLAQTQKAVSLIARNENLPEKIRIDECT